MAVLSDRCPTTPCVRIARADGEKSQPRSLSITTPTVASSTSQRASTHGAADSAQRSPCTTLTLHHLHDAVERGRHTASVQSSRIAERVDASVGFAISAATSRTSHPLHSVHIPSPKGTGWPDDVTGDLSSPGSVNGSACSEFVHGDGAIRPVNPAAQASRHLCGARRWQHPSGDRRTEAASTRRSAGPHDVSRDIVRGSGQR